VIIDTTVDHWMTALNGQTNGTGGAIGQGDEELSSATTGRLHMEGHVRGASTDLTVGIREASIEGLNNATLRSRYLDRKIKSIGMYKTFGFYLGGISGGIVHANGQLGWQPTGRFASFLGHLTIPAGGAFVSADHSDEDDAGQGAQLIWNVLKEHTLRDFEISSVGS